jgi:hypothetical protein
MNLSHTLIKRQFASIIGFIFILSLCTHLQPNLYRFIGTFQKFSEITGIFYLRNFSVFSDHKTHFSHQYLEINFDNQDSYIISVINPKAPFQKSYLNYFLEAIFNSNNQLSEKLRYNISQYYCNQQYKGLHPNSVNYIAKSLPINNLSTNREEQILQANKRFLYTHQCQ